MELRNKKRLVLLLCAFGLSFGVLKKLIVPRHLHSLHDTGMTSPKRTARKNRQKKVSYRLCTHNYIYISQWREVTCQIFSTSWSRRFSDLKKVPRVSSIKFSMLRSPTFCFRRQFWFEVNAGIARSDAPSPEEELTFIADGFTGVGVGGQGGILFALLNSFPSWHSTRFFTEKICRKRVSITAGWKSNAITEKNPKHIPISPTTRWQELGATSYPGRIVK